MKTITINGHKLVMFDSIQEMKIARFQTYNRNVMIDAGIGADLNAFNSRINTIRNVIAKNPEAALTELNNLQQSVYFVMNNVSPTMNSFVAMIHKIDGREVTDEELNPEGIAAIIQELNRKGLTVGVVFGFLAEVKKKLIAKSKSFFRSLSIRRRSKTSIQN